MNVHLVNIQSSNQNVRMVCPFLGFGDGEREGVLNLGLCTSQIFCRVKMGVIYSDSSFRRKRIYPLIFLDNQSAFSSTGGIFLLREEIRHLLRHPSEVRVFPGVTCTQLQSRGWLEEGDVFCFLFIYFLGGEVEMYFKLQTFSFFSCLRTIHD